MDLLTPSYMMTSDNSIEMLELEFWFDIREDEFQHFYRQYIQIVLNNLLHISTKKFLWFGIT